MISAPPSARFLSRAMTLAALVMLLTIVKSAEGIDVAGSGAKTPFPEFEQPRVGRSDGRERIPLSDIAPAPVLESPTTRPSKSLPPQASRRLKEARRLFEEHHYADAVLELEKALRYAPKDLVILRLLGEICCAQGEYAQAAPYLREAVLLDPRDPLVQHLLGVIAASAGDSSKAIRRWGLALATPAIEERPGLKAVCMFLLGKRLREEGYLRASIDLLTDLNSSWRSTDPPNDYRGALSAELVRNPGLIQLLIGQSQLELGQIENAADSFRAVLRVDPTDSEAREMLIRALVYLGKNDEAVSLASESLGAAQTPDRLAKAAAWAFWKSSMSDRLAEELKSDLPDDASRAESALRAAELLGYLGLEGDAIELLSGLADSNGRHATPEVFWKLADLVEKKGRVENALLVLAKAIEADDGGSLLAETLSRAESIAKRMTADELSRLGDKLSAAEPRNWPLHYLLGHVLVVADRKDSAQAKFEATIAIRGDFAPAYEKLGRIVLERRQWQAARKLVEKTSKKLRESPGVIAIRAAALDGLDDYEAAEKAYKSLIKHRPSDPEPLVRLSQLYLRMPQPRLNTARDLLSTFLKANPQSPTAWEALIDSHFNPPPHRDDRPRAIMQMMQEMVQALQSEIGPGLRIYRRHCGATPGYQRLNARRRLQESFVGRWVESRGRSGNMLREIMSTGGPGIQYMESLSKIMEGEQGLQAKLDVVEFLIEYDQFEAAEQLFSDLSESERSTTRALELGAVLDRYFLRFEADLEKAQALFGRFPNRWQYKEMAAEAAIVSHKFDQAAELYEQLAEISFGGRKNNELRRKRVQALLYADRCDEAIDLAARETEENDMNLFALYNVLLSCDRLDDLKKSLIEREKLTAMTDEAFEALSATGASAFYDLSMRRGEFETAQRIMRPRSNLGALRATEGGQLWNMDRYMRALLADGKFGQVLEELRGGGEEPNDTGLSRFGLLGRTWEVRALLGLGRRDEALELTRRFERAAGDPIGRDLRIQLSTLYMFIGREDLAELHLKAILDEFPNDGQAGNDLGYFWADRGIRLEAAEEMIRNSVGKSPRQGAYLDSLGWVLYKQKRYDEAVKWLEMSARVLDIPDPVVYDHLGDAYWMVGQKEKAADAWRRSVEAEAMSKGWRPPSEVINADRKLEQLANDESPDVAPIGSAFR
jgi:tetratricopeptide (TPR) repeat protein